MRKMLQKSRDDIRSACDSEIALWDPQDFLEKCSASHVPVGVRALAYAATGDV